jgi:serine kinase of HPr protein (carbohydrate metabolism regulator)
MMARVTSNTGRHELTVEAFGVRARMVIESAGLLDRVLALLPPGSRRCSPTGLEATFGLRDDVAGKYELTRDGSTLAGRLELEVALEVLERHLHALVALKAPDHVFVHAGVVAHMGAAIVMPGESHAGKTTLVAALVRAGAEYYSDEFAPIDDGGLVHPFARPLALRTYGSMQVEHHVEAMGGVAGEKPVPVGAVLVTRYEAGADWRPRPLSTGEAALALLSHTVPAQTRPAQALRAISRSVETSAAVVEGARGEADAVASVILADLERALSGG